MIFFMLQSKKFNFMFTLKTSNANRGHYKKECTPLLKHAVSEIMLTTNVH